MIAFCVKKTHVVLITITESVGKIYLFAQPKAVVNSEGVDGDRQVLCMDLGELFAA
jgi:hypothetical protein